MSLLCVLSFLLVVSIATLSDVPNDDVTANDVTSTNNEDSQTAIVTKETSSSSDDVVNKVIELRMPNITTSKHDVYLVTPVKLDFDDGYIVGYNPKASANTVHHILIYGCTAPYHKDKTHWVVGDMGGICDWQGEINTILWAWALDAPHFEMPANVAFHVGSNANINYLLLQVHYKNKIESIDASGVDVLIQRKEPQHLAGIYLFATGGTEIPGHMTVNADTTCEYNDEEDMTPFAFRTHTHKLGVRVSAWRERDGDWTLLGTGDPQKPQMFYLMGEDKHVIKTGDKLHARCVYVNEHDTKVLIGSTASDEMCNFYMMYYQTASKFSLESGCFREKEFTVPDYAQVQITELEHLSYEVDTNWTSPNSIKQIGGMACSADHSQLVVFHRADHDWSKKQWFDENNVVLFKDNYIKENPIIFLDPVTGTELRSMGATHFIMPHGVYVDHDGNVWVTDVALHQVLKFDFNTTEPSLVLGTKLVPGSDTKHFCKPTSVVVDADDNIYVSDGYCNSRVVKFTKFGVFLAEFGSLSVAKGVVGGMNLVHDLAINHLDNVIYVADRENGQIHTMNYEGEFLSVHSIPGQVYAIEYIPELQSVAAVNVSDMEKPAALMILDPKSGNITATYPNSSTPFNFPHAVAHIRNIGLFVGELLAPFTIWKLREIKTPSQDSSSSDDLFSVLTSNIPLSFVLVILVLAIIPVTYMSVLLVIRCRRQRHRGAGDKFDKTGFQKLLRDYDSSDEEEDLVFKNSKVYK